jgi:hypothetical protein
MSRLKIKLKSYNKAILMSTVYSLQAKCRAAGLRCVNVFFKHNRSLLVSNASHHCYAKTNKRYAYFRELNAGIFIEGPRNLIMNQLNHFKINSQIKAVQVSFLPSAHKPAASAHKPVSSAKKPNTSAKKPNASASGPVSSAKKPVSSAKKPNASAKKPNASAKKPNASAKKPNASAKKPVSSAKKPNTSAKKPNASASGPSASSGGPSSAA